MLISFPPHGNYLKYIEVYMHVNFNYLLKDKFIIFVKIIDTDI